MNLTRSKPVSIFICMLLGIPLAAFTGYKAYHMSFTFDESATWIDQMYHSFWDIVTYKFPNASNHVFNTLYMKYCSRYIGNSEFELRFLSWFSHLVYIIFSIKIIQVLKQNWLIIPAFIFLNINPYLLDYFSLARGYGLALAMMMGSLYYLIRFINHGKQWRQSLSLFFGILAVLANFSWLNFYLGLCSAILVYNYLQNQKSFISFIKSLIPLLAAGVLLLTIIFLPLQRLQTTHQFFFGGKKGFWIDIIFQLVKDSLYTNGNEQYASLLFTIILVVFSLCFFLMTIRLFNDKTRNISSPAIYLFLILFTVALSTEIQHFLIGTLFLTDRTALMFIPLSALFIIFVLNEVEPYKVILLFIKPIALLAGFLPICYFLYVINFSSVHDFFYDSNTKNMVSLINRMVPQNQRKPNNIILKEPWIYVPTTNFYLKTRGMDWVRPLDMFKKDDSTEADYYYQKNVDANDRTQYQREHRTIIAEYPSTNNTLVKWKNN